MINDSDEINLPRTTFLAMVENLIEMETNKYEKQVKKLQLENEFLKHKNRQYREEIYNYEMKKV